MGLTFQNVFKMSSSKGMRTQFIPRLTTALKDEDEEEKRKREDAQLNNEEQQQQESSRKDSLRMTWAISIS